MSFHPLPLNVVRLNCLIKPDPQILIFHRLARTRFPVIFFSIKNPFCNAVFHILTVAVQNHGTGFF